MQSWVWLCQLLTQHLLSSRRAPLDLFLSGHQASSWQAGNPAACQERCLKGASRKEVHSALQWCWAAGGGLWRSGARLAPRCRSKLETGLENYRLKYIDTGSATPIYHVLGYGFIFSYAVAWPQVRSSSCLFVRGWWNLLHLAATGIRSSSRAYRYHQIFLKDLFFMLADSSFTHV